MILSIRFPFPPICGTLRGMRTTLSLLMLAALLLPGCSRPRAAGRVAQGNHDQVFHWGNGADPGDLDPQTDRSRNRAATFSTRSSRASSHRTRRICTRSRAWPKAGTSRPDARAYTFHLRRDAKWSNGDPVTAHDFIESWHRLLSPALGAQYAEMLYQDAAIVNARAFYDGKLTDFDQVGLQAPDDHTFVVHLVNPTDYFLSMLEPRISSIRSTCRRSSNTGDSIEKGTAWTRPDHFVGNGPFYAKILASASRKSSSERSPTYWDAQNVRLKEIHYYPTDNTDSEERDFRAGLLHVTYELPPTKIDDYANTYPGGFPETPYLGTYFLRFNITAPRSRTNGCAALCRWPSTATASPKPSRGAASCPRISSPRPTPTVTPAAPACPPITTPRAACSPRPAIPAGQGLPPVEILINTGRTIAPSRRSSSRPGARNSTSTRTIRIEEFKVYLDSSTRSIIRFAGPRGSAITRSVHFPGNFRHRRRQQQHRFRQPAVRPPDRPLPHGAERARAPGDFSTGRGDPPRRSTRRADYSSGRGVYLKQPSVKGWYPNVLDRHMPKFIYLEEDRAERV